MVITAAQRARLPPSAFACPQTRSFPFDTKKRAAAAHGRWHNPRTKESSKCAGGHGRIVKAECRFGITPQDAACPLR